jgi:ATP-binding cassette, subfamily B (MDR/TAP), member 1
MKSREASGGSYAEIVTPKDTATKEDDADHAERLRDGDAHAISTTALVTTASTTAYPHSPADAPLPSPTTPVTLRDLYRYASPWDRLLLAIGLAMVTINGALFPAMAVLFGEAISAFQPVDMPKIERVSGAFASVAVALFATDYVAHVCLETTAQKQMHALRIHVFRHVVHKQVAWFDQSSSSTSKVSVAELQATTTKIKDAMGVKLGEVLRCLTQFCVGYAIGFYHHWELSIVMAAVMPFMAMSLSWIIKTLRVRAIFSQQKYAEAGGIADETLRAIRTVQAFNGEARAVTQYVTKARVAESENIAMVRVLSIVLGIFFGMVWVTYGVGLWFGASLVANGGETDPRTVFSAFYGILIGTISLAQVSPNVAAVVTAKAIATPLFAVLNEPSLINAEAVDEGIVPCVCRGRIEIRHVEFAYPSRPGTPVLREYNLTVEAGETVAFVGPSGGGKSTLMALLQRFYDPDVGQILLDGYRLHDLQLKWLRRQMGVVSQEPVLFAGTIGENIASALPELEDDDNSIGGTADKLERRQARVQASAKQAHAHDFIMALPHGYDTLVGEKGVALSGGQKQRIAIARALVRDPRILILDEATSALDTESEAQIQQALESIMAPTESEVTRRTTLIIAHRLSTIKRADRICVVVDGLIVETGTHEELLRDEDGKFHELVAKSQFHAGALVQRNASLMWCDSLLDVLSERESSVPMLAARSVAETNEILDSKRSDPSFARVPVEAEAPASVEPVLPSSEQSPARQEPPSWSTLQLVRRLLQHTRPERHLLILGLLAAALNGASFPVSAILLSAIVSAMVTNYAAFVSTRQQSYLDSMYDDVWRLAVAYLAGAVLLMAITFTQSYAYRYQAELLVTRLRELYFRAMCHRSLAFFDDPLHGSGALASDLATRPTQAVVLAGDTPGRLTQAMASFVGALLVSFCMGSWRLSLVLCVLLPLLVLSDFIRTMTLKGTKSSTSGGPTSDAEASTARANVVAAEAIASIRTVASFGLETRLVDEYRQLSLVPLRVSARGAHRNGLALGFSSFITLAVYALVFWLGAHLVQSGKITFGQLMRSLMAVMISATGIGQATAHLTELDDARAAAGRIFDMEDQASGHQPVEAIEPTAVLGAIEFKDVHFAYPTRPNAAVLRSFSLRIEPGQLVALCGPSGGGKSTVMLLLERFYEPLHGFIRLDGMRLESLDVRWLRSQIGWIPQEPVLFAGSIHDNIAYGAAEPAAVTREQVVRAAEVAHAHAFISAFPDGYETQVGGSGDQLSGGQKQRLAIARAVLKDPAIQLLDEATSALDADSEQLVQDALEQLLKLKRRTTLVIAHRMRTIRQADVICVVANGAIVEQGTHGELVRVPHSLYAKLVENSHDERFSIVE